MAINLFIDSNIFLDFYHLSGPDIEELNKLVALLDQKVIALFVPRQVCDEFFRNRDNKIKDAMKEFKKTKFTISVPAFCKQYAEYGELQKTLKSADQRHSDLLKKAMEDVSAGALSADKVIRDLFGKSTVFDVDEQTFNKAERRFRLGNPPGKKEKTIGDEINWEVLMKTVPDKQDLYLVSADGDYAGELDADKLHPYLDREWGIQKQSKIHYYNSLPEFLKATFPHIKLASDVEKNILLGQLSSSGNFSITHRTIAKLAGLDNFAPEDIELLIWIAENNNQVSWIMGDADVFNFYSKLRNEYGKKIPNESLTTLNQLLDENNPHLTH